MDRSAPQLRHRVLRGRDPHRLALAAGRVRGRLRVPGAVPLSFADHFSSVAARYAAFRPRYPQALADALAALVPAPHTRAWDAGCGNGQLSVLLAAHFAHVIATEPAQAQLDVAIAHPRVEYRRARAEDPVLPASSVDLAVSAQAAHWFDWPRYVAEVERVTRPGALVALVSYGLLHVAEAPAADAAVTRYYRDDAGPYWPPGREHVENGYRDLAWPWPAVAAPVLDMTARWTRDELVGYITTWSATVKLVDADGPGALERLRDQLAATWPADERKTITWPLTLRLARR